MSAASDKAAFPEPYQILGLRLLPLSLGRYQLLRRFEVGFVSDEGTDFEMADFILALLICSMPVREFLGWFGTKKFHKQVRRWGRKLKRGFLIHEKVGLFRRYLEQGSKMPKFWDESQGDAGGGGHWSHAVEVTLRSEIGWTEEEINERPLTKAMADWLKYLENQGAVRLLTPEEIAAGEANAKVYEAMVKAGGLN